MKYQYHVLSLVFAGALIAMGAFIFATSYLLGLTLIIIGFFLYIYGYGIKR